jgi:two-component system alkaline phosphatase synthesis response regulator PhoP
MKKILIVEDDQDISDAVNLFLSSEGFQTHIVTNSTEVYKEISSFSPNLIILDVLLSGIDGRTICTKLKSNNQTKHIPIIMISAHPTVKDLVEKAGADSFIPKPFSIDILLSEIKKFL